MADVTFKLRKPSAKTPQIIYLVYRFGQNEKLAYSTGLKILPAYWNKEKMRVRNLVEALDKDLINNYLNELYRDTNLHIVELKTKGKAVTKDSLYRFLQNYTNKTQDSEENTLHGFVKAYLERNKTKINPSTGKIIAYKTQREHENTYKLLTDFEKAKNKGVHFDFDDINLDFYADFTTFLQSFNMATNTIGHKIQTLKTWLNEATERGVNKNQQYKSHRFKAVLEETENIYLTPSELEKIYTYKFTSEKHIRVRDLFLIGAFTGLRFSDFTSITADNIKNDTLHIEQQKTGNSVSISIHPIVVEIWNKYGGELPKVISNQKFNEYLKEVCKVAGINSIEQKGITKGGIRRKQNYEKWQLVSSHTARRSFATNLYLSGFPTLSIMAMTGHKTESAFMKYIKVTNEQHAELLRLHWIDKGEHLRVVK
ncbi:MAG: tyrosine-type recombinase/integrase [Suipraeoptans sp.]